MTTGQLRDLVSDLTDRLLWHASHGADGADRMLLARAWDAGWRPAKHDARRLAARLLHRPEHGGRDA